MSRQFPAPSQHTSKLPKFLHKQSARERSKSITDPSAPATASTSSSTSDVSSPAFKPRKSSKFLGMQDKDKDKDKDKDEKARRSTDAPSPSNPAANWPPVFYADFTSRFLGGGKGSESDDDWRRPPHALYVADYATYVQILTLFFDTMSPEAPFSVHRTALAGKEGGRM
ncbi:hypothetical protein FPV67DRAFT_1666134 [Lyophyllum atratum]|nr:hypothetical protein FPV67DRAFT_1666134 [Lyophyllum atratum]